MIKEFESRSKKAWSDREFMDALYRDAFDYAIPYRRPQTGRHGRADARVEKIYDNTALVSTFAGAGRLQHDLFPPGEKFFTFGLGPVGKKAFKVDDANKVETERELDEAAEIIGAFFNDEFDQASLETCIDLYAGNGVLIPIPGDDDNPIRWVNVPMDDVAFEAGPYGDVTAAFWKAKWTYRQIKEAFPNGTYPRNFETALENSPDTPTELEQSFVWNSKKKRWCICAWTSECLASDTPIAFSETKTKPLVTARYHRVPGEANGRGPLLLALPTIKTLNKASELLLKSAAIQMLGLWGYRPNSAFNPESVRIAPGAFWPMSSTGGVMGPDVSRLDPPAAKMDVAQLITSEMRMQLQSAMNDERLPDKGATPVSATEIMARMKRVSQNYIGAYGRLVNEIVPVLVRRVAEILNDKGLLVTKFPIDNLLVKVDVQSPMIQAIKSTALAQVFQYIELVQSIKGPQGVELLVKLDDLLREAAEKMGVPARFRMSRAEQKALEAKLANAAAAMAAAQAQQNNGPPQPEPVAA